MTPVLMPGSNRGRPFVGAIDVVPGSRVDVEARDVLRLEGIGDLTGAQALHHVDFAVAVAAARRVDRAASHQLGVVRGLGLQVGVGQRVDRGGLDALEHRSRPACFEALRISARKIPRPRGCTGRWGGGLDARRRVALDWKLHLARYRRGSAESEPQEQ